MALSKIVSDATLEPLGAQHLEKARAWRNDRRIWQWCRQQRPITERDQAAWYQRQNDDPTIQMFAIIGYGARKELVGVCGLTSIDFINRKAEFSLYIGPNHWRRGYARSALKQLVAYGFDDLGLNLIWGETFDGNPAQQMFKQLGFKKTGTMPQAYWKQGRFIDAHLYCLTRDDQHADSGGNVVATLNRPTPGGRR